MLPAPADLPFPHVNQVWLIERYVTDTRSRHLRTAAQLGVASHTPEHATPTRLRDPAGRGGTALDSVG